VSDFASSVPDRTAQNPPDGGYRSFSDTWSDGDTTTGPTISVSGNSSKTIQYKYPGTVRADGVRVYPYVQEASDGYAEMTAAVLFADGTTQTLGTEGGDSFGGWSGTWYEYTHPQREVSGVEMTWASNSSSSYTFEFREAQPNSPLIPHTHDL
jgi:hypothetical protein